MKQRGSALIIAMMLIATVGAAAFGIARLLYVDTSISTVYENGALAYYAAESGMEEGFLRYKYNMNAEVPYTSWTLNGTNVFRTNLTGNLADSGTAGAGILSTNALASDQIDKQNYDLQMGYLGTYDNITKTYKPFFHHDTNNDGFHVPDVFDANYSTGDYSFLRVPKDEARKFDLSNLDLRTSSTNVLDVGFKFIGVNPSNNTDKYNDLTTTPTHRVCYAMAEVKILVKGGTPTAKEYKALTTYNRDNCAGVINIEASKLDDAFSTFRGGGYINGSAGGYSLGNQDYYYSLNDIVKTVVTTKGGDTIAGIGDVSSITIKPLYYPADVMFFTVACASGIVAGTCPNDNKNNIVTGPYSYITSTGYYGGVTRTLKANIDRQSGTLYDLYDYVLFKGN